METIINNSGAEKVDALHQQAALARIEEIKREVAEPNDDNLVSPVPLFSSLTANRA